MRNMRTIVACIGLLLFSFPAIAATLKKVTLLQPVPTIDIRNAPWAVAQEMGWLAEGGLEVEVQFAKGSIVLVQQILSGAAQYGMSAPEPALVALEKGSPLKFFYASTTKSPFPIAVLEDSPVRELKDLKGTTIGLHSMTGVQFYTTQSILRSAGLKMSEDFRYVEVGAGPAAFKALQDGRVAALSINIFTYGGFESRGAKLRYMSSPEVAAIFGWGLVTSPEYLEANRQEAINLARAFTKGHIFCRMKPAECVRIFLKRFPTVRSPGLSDEQIVSGQLRILEKFIEYAPQTPGKPWGWYEAADWKAVVDYMVASGQLERSIDASRIYTNSLLDEINKVDVTAIANAKPK